MNLIPNPKKDGGSLHQRQLKTTSISFAHCLSHFRDLALFREEELSVAQRGCGCTCDRGEDGRTIFCLAK